MDNVENLDWFVDSVIKGSANTDLVKMQIDSLVGAVLGRIPVIEGIEVEKSERHYCIWSLGNDGDGAMEAVCWIGGNNAMPELNLDKPRYESSRGGAKNIGIDRWYMLNSINRSLPVFMKLALRLRPELKDELAPFVNMSINAIVRGH